MTKCKHEQLEVWGKDIVKCHICGEDLQYIEPVPDIAGQRHVEIMTALDQVGGLVMEIDKKMTGTEALNKILDELLALSDEDLKARIDEHAAKGEKHWAVDALERTGYFERLQDELKNRSDTLAKTLPTDP